MLTSSSIPFRWHPASARTAMQAAAAHKARTLGETLRHWRCHRSGLPLTCQSPGLYNGIMLETILTFFLGSKHERDLKELVPIVQKINARSRR